MTISSVFDLHTDPANPFMGEPAQLRFLQESIARCAFPLDQLRRGIDRWFPHRPGTEFIHVAIVSDAAMSALAPLFPVPSDYSLTTAMQPLAATMPGDGRLSGAALDTSAGWPLTVNTARTIGVPLEGARHGEEHPEDPEGAANVAAFAFFPPVFEIQIGWSFARDNSEIVHGLLMAEVAHMVDFHWLGPRKLRRPVWNIVHGAPPGAPQWLGSVSNDYEERFSFVEHGHAWLVQGAYNLQVGETWMELFFRAYAPGGQSTPPLGHALTETMVAQTQAYLAPYIGTSGPTTPQQPTGPQQPAPPLTIPSGSLLPPTSISYSPGGTYADVTWAAVSGATHYDYEHRGAADAGWLGSNRHPSTSVRITTFGMTGPDYLFRLRGTRDTATGLEVSEWSDWFPFRMDALPAPLPPPTPTPTDRPPVVTGVRAVAAATTATVLWDPSPLPVADVYGYEVEWRAQAATDWQRVSTLNTATRQELTGLTPGAAHFARVRVMDVRAALSDWPLEVAFTTTSARTELTPPPAPNVTGTSQLWADITLPTYDPTGPIWSYDVEWRLQANPSAPWQVAAKQLGVVRCQPLQPDTGYVARLRAYVLIDPGAATFTYTDSGPERAFRTLPGTPPPPEQPPPVPPPVVNEPPPPPPALPDGGLGPPGRIETGCTTIYVRDAGLYRLGEVDDFTELDVTLAENAAGPWKLTMPADHPMALALTFRGGLEVWRNGRLLMAGPVTALRARREGRTHVLTAEGFDDNDVLTGRLALPNPTDPARPQTGAFFGSDVFRGTAEAALRYFVGRNVGPSAIAARRIADLVLEPDQGRGRTVTARPPRFDQLLPFLSRLAFSAGVTFRVEQRGQTRVFSVRTPQDVSRDVVFGLDRGNLLGYELTINRPTANYVYTGGPGVAGARIVWLGQDPESITSFGRREVFLDESGAAADDTQGITVAELLEEATQQELAEQRMTSAVSLSPQDTADTAFGEHYNLGDRVTVRLEGGAELVERIGQVRYLLTPTAETVVPTVASEGQPISTRGLAARLRRTARRLTVVEGT